MDVVTEHVRVEMRRFGGFAGLASQVRLDSARMPPAEGARLVQLVSGLDLARLSRTKPGPAAGADLMTYRLTVERGDHRWQGTVRDPDIPSELRPLLQFLSQYS